MLEFLGIVLDLTGIAVAFGYGVADGEQQRGGAGSAIVHADGLTTCQVVSNYVGHELRNRVRRVKLAGLLAGVCCEHVDEVLVDKAQNIVVSLLPHGDRSD